MPYIKQEERDRFELDNVSPSDFGILCKGPGDLNYLISLIVLEYIETRGESYSVYNEVIGVLECAKQELYRRKVAPYEDKKVEENGDI